MHGQSGEAARAKSLSRRVSEWSGGGGSISDFRCLCGAHVAQTGRRINGVTQTDPRPRRPRGEREGEGEGAGWGKEGGERSELI